MKIRVSIPSGVIAAKLMKKLKLPHARYSYAQLDSPDQYGDLRFSLRLCTRGGEPSGGAVLRTEVLRDRSVTGAKTSVIRLRAGWSEKTVSRAVYRKLQWACSQRELWIARLVLHKLAEKHEVPEDFTPPEGREDGYSDMSMEDIHFWHRFIPANFTKLEGTIK